MLTTLSKEVGSLFGQPLPPTLPPPREPVAASTPIESAEAGRIPKFSEKTARSSADSPHRDQHRGSGNYRYRSRGISIAHGFTELNSPGCVARHRKPEGGEL